MHPTYHGHIVHNSILDIAYVIYIICAIGILHIMYIKDVIDIMYIIDSVYILDIMYNLVCHEHYRHDARYDSLASSIFQAS